MTENDPFWPKNGQKMAKNDQKSRKNGQKWTKNDQVPIKTGQKHKVAKIIRRQNRTSDWKWPQEV